MKSVVPLVAAIVMFGLAWISIRRPEWIRSSMRDGSPKLLPAKVRETAIGAAPVMFAFGSILLGLAGTAAFLLEITGH